MSIDYYSCENCGTTFPDCGDYVNCECGKRWCSDKCADEDGYENARCKLEVETEDGYTNDCLEGFQKCIRRHETDAEGEVECYGCENYQETSCSYCRHEEYDDYDLLVKAMELLKCDRQFLIDKINESK